jgi:hypothetical protein
MIRHSILGAIIALLSTGQVFAQDWKVSLGSGEFYLDTRTIKDHAPVFFAWIRGHNQTDEGIITGEMEMIVNCTIGLVQKSRLVIWGHHFDDVQEVDIPDWQRFEVEPLISDTSRDLLNFFCQ